MFHNTKLGYECKKNSACGGLSFENPQISCWKINIFCPPWGRPWGANFLLPPMGETLGGKWKKHLPPTWGAKYTPLSGCMGIYQLAYFRKHFRDKSARENRSGIFGWWPVPIGLKYLRFWNKRMTSVNPYPPGGWGGVMETFVLKPKS